MPLFQYLQEYENNLKRRPGFLRLHQTKWFSFTIKWVDDEGDDDDDDDDDDGDDVTIWWLLFFQCRLIVDILKVHI